MSKSQKTVDSKNKMANFFKDDIRRFINDDVNCHILARVIKYDKDSHRCDCQPLALQSDGDKRATLVECIVPSSIWQTDKAMAKAYPDWKPMRVNSVVWIEFGDREMDNWTGTSNYKIDSTRMHSIQDPYVGSVVTP